MSIFVFCSAGGSPGVTTTALALAANWPRRAIVVDADPHPSQSVLAGYLAGRVEPGGDLGDFAEAVRSGEISADLLSALAIGLPGVERASFVPGFRNPNAPGLFADAMPELVAQAQKLADEDVDIFFDLGRLDVANPAAEIFAAADYCFLVCRSSLPSLACAKLWLPNLLSLYDSVGSLGIVLIGAGRPYNSREIAAQFDLPVFGEVAWAPRAAAQLSEQAPRAFISERNYNRSLHLLTEKIFSDSALTVLPGQAASTQIRQVAN